MTPEAQRIALAKAFPTVIRANITESGYWADNPKWEWRDGSRWHQCHKNDPLCDLNALHEAEMTLKPYIRRTEYRDYLSYKAYSDERISTKSKRRAMALLRTSNLWTS